jgi:hypothetical protein
MHMQSKMIEEIQNKAHWMKSKSVTGKFSSITPWSLANLFKILPLGLAMKKDKGHRTIAHKQSL